MDGISSALQNLVSALGGRDPTEPGNPYVLGDDGLGCLRDIKRWLQHYDEKKDVWDVKSALASMNVVATDICPILGSWQISEAEDEVKRRICLACVEILVPLTWPMELGADADEFKIKQFPNLRLAQSGYKRAILFDPERDLLSSIMRVAFPSLALTRRERSDRDSGIIRLVVYLLRNLAAIDEAQSRSDTILAFQKSNALDFLCVLASGMGEDFVAEDVIVIDVLYYLLRGVDNSLIFDLTRSGSDEVKKELTSLLAREKDMKSNIRKQGHTRHNRFGTMVSVVQNSRRFTVASQTAIIANIDGNNFTGMEATKKWNKPQRQIKTYEDVDLKVNLNTEAKMAISGMVGTFLDSGFNPLFSSLLKALEHDDSRVSQSNRLQFLYLQGWFFRALREQGKSRHRKDKTSSDFVDDADYQLIASMMESRATIMLRKMLRESLESKLWKETHAAMDCLKELLLTIHSMSLSSNAEYQEIAENLQSNLYYEETNLDLIASCVRTYTTQSLGYLNACTDLASVLLKMLEKFASTKTHMFVRARRQRQRKKIAPPRAPQAEDSDEEQAQENAKEVVRERAFNFAKFEHKFMNDHSVDTFISLLEYYADLSSEQIKRAISFLHRVFVKQKIELLVYRLEIFELLNRMIRDKVGLPATSPARSEVENFTVYLVKRFTKALQDSPTLAVEILFEKLSNDPYYLNHDANKAPVEPKIPRAPAEWELKSGIEHDEGLRIVVGLLLDENRSEFLNWLKTSIGDVVSRRLAWESLHRTQIEMQESGLTDAFITTAKPSAETLSPTDQSLKLLMFKDGKVRLLLKLLAFERVGDREDPDALWLIPTTMEVDQLNNDLQLLKKYTHEPPSFESGTTAADFVRRQVNRRNSYNTDSSSSDLSSDSDGLPRIQRRKKQKTARQPRRKVITEVNYEEIEARRLRRLEKEEERKGNIKSSKYVHDSDDEDDEAANAIFFAAEAALRERQKLKANGLHLDPVAKKTSKRRSRTRKASEEMSDIDRHSATSSNKENRPAGSPGSSATEDESLQTSRRRRNPFVERSEDDDDEAEERVVLGTKKRVSSGAIKHANALFVQDESSNSDDDDDDDDEHKRNNVVRQQRSTAKRHIVNSEDED